MAAEKQVAHGTLFKTDVSGALATMALVREVTPPPREREEVDGRDLVDDFDVPLLGIEVKSSFSVQHFWHPGDDDHEDFDVAFDDKTEIQCQVVTPHDTPVTEEFDAVITKLEPAALQPNGTYQRTMTFLRITDITRT